ncbi:MAG: hypothetical protein E6J35_00745 [Chloroflexi bacterium]|nr:MAG: hypothetical protein E6J35_00745 [Chloroflexota bacterium]
MDLRDVIGQRRLLARLGERAVRGDVAHGYELSGPRSIGKHTLALRLAQTLNCATEPVVPGGCGVCIACRKIERGLHPDVREITRLVDQAKRDDRKNITIEQIREMQQDLALRPLEGRRRVVIIDDAADLSEHAEVALLKTLEEPPPHAVLLLITPTPSRLLETIRSRLQPLPFRSVARLEIERALVARFGQGASRFAAPAERFAWAAALADERDSQKRSELIETRLVNWSELVRDAAVAGTGVVDRAMRPDRTEESRRLAAKVTTRDLVELAQRMERWRRDVVETTVSARMLLELFVLKLPYDETFAEAA